MLKTAAEFIAAAQEQVSCVDADGAKQLYEAADGAVILDVRESETHARSSLPGAVNVPRGLLEMQVPKQVPDPGARILVHCGGGGRASLAALTLRQMGYTDVYAVTARFEDLREKFR